MGRASAGLVVHYCHTVLLGNILGNILVNIPGNNICLFINAYGDTTKLHVILLIILMNYTYHYMNS